MILFSGVGCADDGWIPDPHGKEQKNNWTSPRAIPRHHKGKRWLLAEGYVWSKVLTSAWFVNKKKIIWKLNVDLFNFYEFSLASLVYKQMCVC